MTGSDARPLVIVGAGGFGAEVAALCEDLRAGGADQNLVGFLDEDPSTHGSAVLGRPVLGNLQWLGSNPSADYVLAIGSPLARHAVAARASAFEARPRAIVHPAASVHRSTDLGAGAIICRGATVTVRGRIGRFCIVNLGCTVGHDCALGDSVTLHPGTHLSGGVSVGTRVEFGTGSVVLPGLTVADDARVGAGAVVTKDVEAGVVVVGVPARPLRSGL